MVEGASALGVELSLARPKRQCYSLGMTEKELIRTFNELRTQRIKAQLAPTILLAVILALVATGHISDTSPMIMRLFVMGLVIAGGVFSTTTMLATVRDSVWVIDSLAALKDLSPFGRKLVAERGMTVFNAFPVAILTTFNFVVLWVLLYR